MAIGAAVMLLGLHFVYNNLGALEFFKNFSFNGDSLEIRLADMELAVVLECQNTAKINFATDRSLRIERMRRKS